ncbi:MAG: septum formation protein Maf [Thermotogaceae bacterium]|nr:septum formation protein Maf [Thermotogaceae bacterium]
MIILASSSERRVKLFSLLGLPFKAVSPSVEEISSQTKPEDIVVELAQKKANAVYADYPGDTIISADTIVWIDGCMMGKPKDENEAWKMLSKLSGNWHEVFTGVCIKSDVDDTSFCEITQVKFRTLNEFEIEKYISTKDPMDKAGAYGIQGFASVFVEKIVGDYTNVVGLPLPRLWKTLLDRGIVEKYVDRKWPQREIDHRRCR